jgi:hypothetical protein
MPEITSERLALFDPLVAEVMAEWRIPGLAMAAQTVLPWQRAG